MFLASVYGMETKESRRDAIKEAVIGGVNLTAARPKRRRRLDLHSRQRRRRLGHRHAGAGAARRAERRLRGAAGTIDEAVHYIERCSTPEGGICYSLGSGGGPRLPISAAAVATLYNAGEYDAPVANRCLDYVWQQFRGHQRLEQARRPRFLLPALRLAGFYLAGDKYWDKYFPAARDQLLTMQDKATARGTATASARPTARRSR